MAKKKPAPKKLKKKTAKSAAAKKVARKVKVSAKAKKTVAAKAKTAAPKKTPEVKSKIAPKKKPVKARATVAVGSQDVETVRLKPKSRVARAGAGAGDLQGISIVEDVDSESADELLEEGQAFEAGIVSGVEDAGDADGREVTTHEVPQDDVPGEYDGKDRP